MRARFRKSSDQKEQKAVSAPRRETISQCLRPKEREGELGGSLAEPGSGVGRLGQYTIITWSTLGLNISSSFFLSSWVSCWCLSL